MKKNVGKDELSVTKSCGGKFITKKCTKCEYSPTNSSLNDDLVKRLVHKELESKVEDIFMTADLKERIIITISHQSLFAKIKTSINNFLNYQIPIPVQLAAFCLVIAITVGGILLSASFRVTNHDIEASRIHIESSGEGGAYESSQN